MHCPMDFSGHDSGKQPHNERHLTTVNKKKKKKKNMAENAGIFLPIWATALPVYGCLVTHSDGDNKPFRYVR